MLFPPIASPLVQMLPIFYLLLRFCFTKFSLIISSLLKTPKVFSSYWLHCTLLLVVKSKIWDINPDFWKPTPTFLPLIQRWCRWWKIQVPHFLATVPEEVARECYTPGRLQRFSPCCHQLFGPQGWQEGPRYLISVVGIDGTRVRTRVSNHQEVSISLRKQMHQNANK